VISAERLGQSVGEAINPLLRKNYRQLACQEILTELAQRGCDVDHIITSKERRENAGTRLNRGRMPFHFGGQEERKHAGP
jgi:hypothetical protein